MRFLLMVAILAVFGGNVNGQDFYRQPFAHTFSIVAVDSLTGEIGAAVQSHWFSVGSIVTWAEAGVGAVATQSFVNVSLGPKGLALMKSGKSAREALGQLIAEDPGRDFRQVGIIDARGNSAAYTGKKCIAEAGQVSGKYFSVQANMMLKNTVWSAMARAFKTTKAPLAERMVAALEAAQAEGGDIRGQQSAAILVVRGKPTGNTWEDRLIDLRVEDHPQAVREIKRILKVYRAYEHMNTGDLAIEHQQESKALQEYGAAMNMLPDNLEMKYWTAVSLANIGKFGQALPLFKEVFAKDENWRTMTPRLQPNGLLKVTPTQFDKIMNLK